jgi:3-phenylpropionate/cinnamic acid dioxygenase small subunit
MSDTTATCPPEDWIALHSVLMAYAHGIDHHKWDLLRSCFTEDCHVTYGDPWGPLDGIEIFMKFMIEFHEPLDDSSHSTTNVRVVEYDGDTATTHCSVDALLVRNGHPDGDHLRVAGHYVDRFVRTDDGWKIAERDFRRIWAAGNPNVALWDWEREEA